MADEDAEQGTGDESPPASSLHDLIQSVTLPADHFVRTARDTVLASIPRVDPAGLLGSAYAEAARAPLLALAAQAREAVAAQFRHLHETIQGALEVAKETKQRFDLVTIELGWPPPAELTIPQQKLIIQVYDEEGPEAARGLVNDVLPKVYSPEIVGRVLDDWKTDRLLRGRIEILEDAVEAHNDGRYNLSVPALLAQMEGVVADGFGHQGQMRWKRYKKYVRDLLDGDAWWEDDQVVREVILKRVMVTFGHGAPVDSDISRHAILHGGDTGYGRAEVSLKAILLFDAVRSAFRLVATPAGTKYHRYGCGHTEGAGSDRRFFSSTLSAEQQGLTPCKVCRPDES